MSTSQDIFDFLAPYQISDEILSQSYDRVSAPKRALLKQAISFHFSTQKIISPYTGETEQHFSNHTSGLFYSIHKKKAPFLFCVFDNRCSQNKENALSPAILLSIICPAIIAEVENIFLYFFEQPSDAILTTLELCGIENIYIYQLRNVSINQNNYINSDNTLKNSLKNQINEYTETKNQIDSYEKFYQTATICINKLSKQIYTPESYENDNQKRAFKDFLQTKEEQTHANNKPQAIEEKGRVIFFHDLNIQHPLKKDFLKHLHTYAITCYEENTKPSILAEQSQENTIFFAYPYAHIDFVKIENTSCFNRNTNSLQSFHMQKKISMDIISSTLKNEHIKYIPALEHNNIQENFYPMRNYDISFINTIKANQNYTKDMELCYIHPNIKIDFFINTCIVARF